jgi:Tfp pilus assembly protein PilF
MSQRFSPTWIYSLILSVCAWCVSCFPVEAVTPPLQGASAASANQEQARQVLDQGVQAFKEAQFDRAVELFKQALDLDPTLLNAQLYLASAYASQYIPGAPSEENSRIGKLATDA